MNQDTTNSLQLTSVGNKAFDMYEQMVKEGKCTFCFGIGKCLVANGPDAADYDEVVCPHCQIDPEPKWSI